jgi:hypothetical protein
VLSSKTFTLHLLTPKPGFPAPVPQRCGQHVAMVASFQLARAVSTCAIVLTPPQKCKCQPLLLCHFVNVTLRLAQPASLVPAVKRKLEPKKLLGFLGVSLPHACCTGSSPKRQRMRALVVLPTFLHVSLCRRQPRASAPFRKGPVKERAAVFDGHGALQTTASSFPPPHRYNGLEEAELARMSGVVGCHPQPQNPLPPSEEVVLHLDESLARQSFSICTLLHPETPQYEVSLDEHPRP